MKSTRVSCCTVDKSSGVSFFWCVESFGVELVGVLSPPENFSGGTSCVVIVQVHKRNRRRLPFVLYTKVSCPRVPID